jgi:hypothetical protein
MKEVDWEQRKKRKFDPVAIWNQAMQEISDKALTVVEPEITEAEAAEEIKQAVSTADLTEEEKRLKRQEQARKTRDMLLAKNPNHFKELSAKSRMKFNNGL